MSHSRCIEPCCPNDRVSDKNPRCTEHTTAFNRVKNRTLENVGRRADKRYSTKKWRLLRVRVLSEQPICVCGHAASHHVDHIRPPRDGGSFWSRDNLQGMCSPCHGTKTNAEVRARGDKAQDAEPAPRQSSWNVYD